LAASANAGILVLFADHDVTSLDWLVAAALPSLWLDMAALVVVGFQTARDSLVVSAIDARSCPSAVSDRGRLVGDVCQHVYDPRIVSSRILMSAGQGGHENWDDF
jgi:hypothetical protein